MNCTAAFPRVPRHGDELASATRPAHRQYCRRTASVHRFLMLRPRQASVLLKRTVNMHAHNAGLALQGDPTVQHAHGTTVRLHGPGAVPSGVVPTVKENSRARSHIGLGGWMGTKHMYQSRFRPRLDLPISCSCPGPVRTAHKTLFVLANQPVQQAHKPNVRLVLETVGVLTSHGPDATAAHAY